MFRRFTDDARAVLTDADRHARRLGHDWLGTEHLFLAVSSADHPVAEVLRRHGLTRSRIEEILVRLLGATHADPLAKLDRDALAFLGIDIDVVRDRIVATLGADALAASDVVRRRRQFGRARARDGEVTGRLPFTARAKACLAAAVREATHVHSPNLGVEHLALAVAGTPGGLVPRILAEAGVSATRLRAAILGLERRAS